MSGCLHNSFIEQSLLAYGFSVKAGFYPYLSGDFYQAFRLLIAARLILPLWVLGKVSTNSRERGAL